MNLNHLQFVLQVAKTRSFTEAAKQCCVTQPTLSNGIRLLEQQLGGELFVRSTRKVSLTPFGEHLMPSIQSISDARHELKNLAQQYFEPDHQLLAIGFSPLSDMRIINAIVNPFISTNAAVHTHFKECFLETIGERLTDGQINLAIRPVVNNLQGNDSEYQSIPLYREPLFVIPRDGPGCKIAGQGPITIEETTPELFALTPNICGHTYLVQQLFREQGQTVNQYPGQALSYLVMQNWASLGLASAILPWSKISKEFRSKARPLMIKDQQPALLDLELIWHKGTSTISPIHLFLAHCEKRLDAIIRGLHLQDELFQPIS